MVFLYSSGGSGQFELVDFPSSSFAQEEIYLNACKLLVARGNQLAAELLATNSFEIRECRNDFNDEFHILRTFRDTHGYEEWRRILEESNDLKRSYKAAFTAIANVINEMNNQDFFFNKSLYIRFVICEHAMETVGDENQDWRTEFASLSNEISNQALFDFANKPKYKKDGLNFRSKTEIKIYETLVQRGLLIFPLPVAVLGNPKVKREPDFVIAYKGKIGILEIHGEMWHPPETAAKEAERRRSLRNLGVAVYEVFDAHRCWHDPETVVNEFLKAFEI
jgi:hypothetical protein